MSLSRGDERAGAHARLTDAVRPQCLDCGATLRPDDRFCPACGQRTDTHRLRLRDFAHDLLHAFVHVDRSAYALLRALATRPGVVAREYVDGRRRRHFGPFASLVIVVGASSFLISVTAYRSITSDAAPNALIDLLQRHVNLLILAQAPLLGLICRLLFRNNGLNYAEHTVLSAYASTMRATFFAIAVLPVWYLFRPSSTSIAYVYGSIWCAYFGFAAAQFYSGNRAVSWLKGALAAAITQTITTLAISAAVMLYDRLAAST